MLDRFDPAKVSENVRTRFHIGGRRVEPRTSEMVRLTMPAGAPEDMDDAVRTAAEAFENGPWPVDFR